MRWQSCTSLILQDIHSTFPSPISSSRSVKNPSVYKYLFFSQKSSKKGCVINARSNPTTAETGSDADPSASVPLPVTQVSNNRKTEASSSFSYLKKSSSFFLSEEIQQVFSKRYWKRSLNNHHEDQPQGHLLGHLRIDLVQGSLNGRKKLWP